MNGTRKPLPCPRHELALVSVRGLEGFTVRCPVCKHESRRSIWDHKWRPASGEILRARDATHKIFDQLWQERPGRWGRNRAYEWLRDVLGCSKIAAHICHLNVAECAKVQRRACIVLRRAGIDVKPITE